MDLNQLKDHVDDRFDELNKQLSDHLQRTARLESSIKWISSIVAVVTTTILQIFTSK